MPALGVINEEQVAHHFPVHDPGPDLFRAVAHEELLVDLRDIRAFFGMRKDPLFDVFGLPAFLRFGPIGAGKGVVVAHAFGHQKVFEEHVVYKIFLLARRPLFIDPEFVLGDEAEPEMLAKVGELLAQAVTDVFPVHEINVDF
jgi:hypothetical protein